MLTVPSCTASDRLQLAPAASDLAWQPVVPLNRYDAPRIRPEALSTLTAHTGRRPADQMEAGEVGRCLKTGRISRPPDRLGQGE